MLRKKLSHAASALALCLASALPAQAALIDFESVTPGFLAPSVSSGDATFTVGGTGFAGVDVGTSVFSIFGNAPAGNTTQYLYVLNDGTLTLTSAFGAFNLIGFDAAFIAPLPVSPGLPAGQLLLSGLLDGGGVVTAAFDFGLSDAAGDYAFFSVGTPTFNGVTSVTFSACLYDGLGGCGLAATFPAAFAIDNLVIPEPASAVLALSALGLLVATRRRSTR